MLKIGGGEYAQKVSSNKGMSICHILVNLGEISIFCYQEILHIKNTDPKLEKEELVYDSPATLLGSRSLVLCCMTSEERRKSIDEKRRDVNSDEC